MAGKRVGRPKKSEIEAKKKPGTPGRPPGEAAIMKEYRARMLASPKSAKVLEKIFDAALNDDHKHQAAAWKILADRIVPVSSFEENKLKGTGGVTITINTDTPAKVSTEEAIEGEVVEDGS